MSSDQPELFTEQPQRPEQPAPVERARRRRSDAGQVRHTARDAGALLWLAQMYGARMDTLAYLLGTSEDRADAIARRWVRAGWAQRARIEYGTGAWVWPTAAMAATQLGWERAARWRPTLNNVRHHQAVGMVRARLQSQGTPGVLEVEGWVPERVMYREPGWRVPGERVPHIPDGIWHRPASGGRPATAFAVEVELTPKGVRRTAAIMHQVAAVAARYGSPETGRILYVVEGEPVHECVTQAREEAARADPYTAQRVDITYYNQIVRN